MSVVEMIWDSLQASPAEHLYEVESERFGLEVGERAGNELQTAKALGGKRMPLSGAVGGGDVVAEGYSVECKSRADYPALIRDAFAQAESDIAVGDNRRPLVVLKADRKEALYVLKESDFLRLKDKNNTENAFVIRETARAISKLAAEIERKAR